MKIVTHTNRHDIAPFLEIVQDRADSDRDALGFLPKRAYFEAANQEKLAVAVAVKTGSEIYAGHLLFGGRYPNARIFQIYVEPEFRRCGVGRRLVQRVIRLAQAAHYLSTSIRVADDLTDANAFWERMGFKLVRTRPGGASRGRSINIRVRDLNTPSLFDLMGTPESSAEADLHLIERLSTRAPIYVVDLNVMFDVVRKRANAREAGRIIRAGLQNLIRLAVTEEFVTELQRESRPGSSDPILELAIQLPRLPKPPQIEIQDKLDDLGTLIFPERMAKGRLSTQDQSDLIHLATAIYRGAAGFVTNEKAILRARAQLQTTYGLDVIGVHEFARTFELPIGSDALIVRAQSSGWEVRVSELEQRDVSAAYEYLEQMYVPAQLLQDALAAGDLDSKRRRILVRSGEEIAAYASWDLSQSPDNVRHVFICADEDDVAADAIVDHIFERMCIDASHSAPSLLRLNELPGHVITRRKALAHGFRPVTKHAPRGATLQKICVGRPISASNWDAIRLQLRRLAGVNLPEGIPTYDDALDGVQIGSPSGDTIKIPLKDLENLLSPVLFLFAGRAGAIVPIQRPYADDLFGTSPQYSLLARPEAVILKERVYFSSPKTMTVLRKDTPLVFYESSKHKGRSSAIAAARVVDTHLVAKSNVSPDMKRKGVVGVDALEHLSSTASLAAMTFDNIMLFDHPVSFNRLREMGCVDRTNLRTAQRISVDKIAHIIREGRGDV